MAVQSTDLLVVNRTGTNYKVAWQTLKDDAAYTLPVAAGGTLGGVKVGTGLQIDGGGVLSANLPGALTYRGTRDLTAAPPTAPAQGDVYVNNKAGTIAAGWTGLTGTATLGEMVLWDGTKWDIVGNGGAAGVTAVTGTAPVVVGGTAQRPDISVSAATPTTDGLLTAADKTKLDGIAVASQPGTVTTVTASSPIHVTTATTTPALTIDDATTAAKGVVQLADGAAVTAGTAGLVVTADQLKATNDAVALATAGGLPDAPDGTADGTKQYVRQVVRAGTANTKSWAEVTVANATRTKAGVAEIATESEITAGTDDSRFITPLGAKTTLMPYNISTLTVLP
jgi:hypothetical protein